MNQKKAKSIRLFIEREYRTKLEYRRAKKFLRFLPRRFISILTADQYEAAFYPNMKKGK